MFQIHSWPSVILHLDGDAFFASVMQAVNPRLKGKPLAVGRERGIAVAVSYEAKALGIKRGMTEFQIKKICPSCLFIASDYEIYSLYSQKMFSIFKSYIPEVEEYSVDEGFADLRGLRRPLKMSYRQIGKAIKEKIESSLGLSVSVGVSLTKSLAKLASGFQKPSGLTIISGQEIEGYLEKIRLVDVWGIGPQTTAYLNKLGLETALDFTIKSEDWVTSHLSKPSWEIWQELRGRQIYELNTKGKTTFKGITKSQTFSPPTNNQHILWAKVLDHVEQAFTKARRFNYLAGRVTIFLKTQQFRYQVREIKLMEKTAYPLSIRLDLKKAFEVIYRPGILYRSAGCWLTDLQEKEIFQPSLFYCPKEEVKAEKIYAIYETGKVDFGTSLYDKSKIGKNHQGLKFNLPFVSLGET